MGETEKQLTHISDVLDKKKAPSNDGAIRVNIVGNFDSEGLANLIENQSAKLKL
ncbi:hypothetical protein [Weissella cibaria]|uniref:hypothetical protein n=1 Tax=Weissella cibaria TaxID=137591 RepID=UPI0016493E16|nr:hypothetical protein [Weissella cibaria]MBU7560868.1 hypothetical protein [Weissella cibaria]